MEDVVLIGGIVVLGAIIWIVVAIIAFIVNVVSKIFREISQMIRAVETSLHEVRERRIQRKKARKARRDERLNERELQKDAAIRRKRKLAQEKEMRAHTEYSRAEYEVRVESTRRSVISKKDLKSDQNRRSVRRLVPETATKSWISTNSSTNKSNLQELEVIESLLSEIQRGEELDAIIQIRQEIEFLKSQLTNIPRIVFDARLRKMRFFIDHVPYSRNPAGLEYYCWGYDEDGKLDVAKQVP
ncbi:MAG: hypothetical protein H6684_09340 [Deltaproteobacteria bacterium]|nr:hypothetical protein [Deltaproteobacteria bacterium]MCB9488919.1 hypothetical protein [Deltaproteobacteria bacterium]